MEQFNMLKLLFGPVLDQFINGKRRVSKEWFAKFNQSAPANRWYQLLPDEFLELVYEEVDEYLKHKVKHRKHQTALNTTRAQSQSLNNVLYNAKKIISMLGLHESAVFYEKQVRCVKKMFKIMGKPVLNALMGTLILYDDAAVTDLCLSALQRAIHISAVLNLKNDRDALVQALSRLSLAGLKEIKDKTANALVVTNKSTSTTTTENGVTKTTITTTTETKCRNVDIILTLLNVALTEGNHLQSTWLECLKCISSLEASELMPRSSSRNNGPNSRTPSPNPSQSLDNANESKSWLGWAGSLVPSFWDYSGKVDIGSAKQSMDASVSRIFANSTKLDENGIVEFFKALCQVSLIEITHPENPRSFVYEKIFEVAHLNIHKRSSLQWCSIWQVLSDFFSHLACSSDEDVSFFAIDSITKLVVHLLKKETLGNFRFQSHFLKPYETVMQNTPFVSTREYVLGAIAKIVNMNSAQLRSGWIIVFRILESSVFHDSAVTAEASFTMLKNILHMFTDTEANLQSSYQELLKCLIELSFKGPTHNVQLESLQMMQKLAFLVHSKPELFLESESPTIGATQLWIQGWLPIFKELANVVLESEKYDFTDANQAKALTILFELVKSYGESFHASWWQALFEILFAIFHKLKFHGEDAILAEESSKLTKGYNQFYCYYYIQFAIIDTFIRHYDILGKIIMNKLLNELEWCIRQGHDQISLSGVQCLHQVIRMLHNRMTAAEWTLITKLLQNLLHTPSQDKESTWNPVVQLELLKVVKTILIPPLGADSKKIDGESEEIRKSENQSPHSNALAKSSNKDPRNSVGDDNLFLLLDTIEARISLMVTANKTRKNSTIESPDLQVQLQQTLLMDTYLRFLLQMYFHQEWSNDEMCKIELRFVTGITSVLQCFTNIQPITPNHFHDLEEVMTTCIQGLHLQVPPEKFKHFASILYPNLCDLLELELEPKLSTALAKYFLAMIRSKIGDRNEEATMTSLRNIPSI